MPAVRITNVIPMPRIPAIDAWRATFEKFSNVRKCSDWVAPSTISTRNAREIPLLRTTRAARTRISGVRPKRPAGSGTAAASVLDRASVMSRPSLNGRSIRHRPGGSPR
jgi:hypothetical protein